MRKNERNVALKRDHFKKEMNHLPTIIFQGIYEFSGELKEKHQQKV